MRRGGVLVQTRFHGLKALQQRYDKRLDTWWRLPAKQRAEYPGPQAGRLVHATAAPCRLLTQWEHICIIKCLACQPLQSEARQSCKGGPPVIAYRAGVPGPAPR